MGRVTKLTIGDKLEAELEPVTRMDLIKYSGSSGDFNPIHTIDDEAKKAGLPGIIAHGMWTMGNLTKLFTPFYEEGFIQDFKIRFSGMVFLGDVLTLQAVVEEQTEEHVNFKVRVVNQDNKDVMKGSIRFLKTT
ncbi:MaoC/PaaZ C-terminal domain-containing protein [Oceanobacillus sp. HCA-5259]|uniref:MaoC/PaaZ C-terminal domain-containing protein n=1 Tax=Oceanobacillus sp. HCA-5259 TaxID=3134661 RepID=UPI0030C3E37E